MKANWEYDSKERKYYVVVDLSSNLLEAKFTNRSNSRSLKVIEDELTRIMKLVTP